MIRMFSLPAFGGMGKVLVVLLCFHLMFEPVSCLSLSMRLFRFETSDRFVVRFSVSG